MNYLAQNPKVITMPSFLSFWSLWDLKKATNRNAHRQFKSPVGNQANTIISQIKIPISAAVLRMFGAPTLLLYLFHDESEEISSCSSLWESRQIDCAAFIEPPKQSQANTHSAKLRPSPRSCRQGGNGHGPWGLPASITYWMRGVWTIYKCFSCLTGNARQWLRLEKTFILFKSISTSHHGWLCLHRVWDLTFFPLSARIMWRLRLWRVVAFFPLWFCFRNIIMMKKKKAAGDFHQ